MTSTPQPCQCCQKWTLCKKQGNLNKAELSYHNLSILGSVILQNMSHYCQMSSGTWQLSLLSL